MTSNLRPDISGDLTLLNASDWDRLWRCGNLESIVAGFRRFYVADRERAESLLKRLEAGRHDAVINHFASAPDEVELSEAERFDELRAAREALDDNEWISAEEAKRRLLSE